MSRLILSRRRLLHSGLTAAAALPLAGCDSFDFLRERSNPVRRFLMSANGLTYRAQRLLQSADQLATEFSASDIRQGQKPNGSVNPDTPEYLSLKQTNFADYVLEVDGLVERPMRFPLDAIRNMPARTQITRHDCVEGWSTIAKWHGVPLKLILDQVGIRPAARYVMFHCFDAPTKSLSGLDFYYESIDLIDARHPQTILAYAMNDTPLPVAHGAPLRVRVERQLGYKMAKYIRRIELISDFSQFRDGQGSYWADRGYEWYAGI
ncbi:MAG: molybdopterin-dependent oxidoreductase [Proteobacteria bacterium]|nr:molybdopterin-dependent oxidoreductase [Pseudomonadota bacterium]